MKRIITISLATLLISFLSHSQTTQEKPYIEVNGYAEKEIIPDEIYIGINIIEKTENRIKVTIQEQEEKLKTSLKAININLDDFALSDASSDYVRVRWNTKDVITRKSYTLKVGSALQVGQVYLELEKLDIKEARIERVNHSQLDSLKREIRIAAIKDAKTKADYLLNSIGEKTGNALVVSETPTTVVGQANRNDMRRLEAIDVVMTGDLPANFGHSYGGYANYDNKSSSMKSDTIEFRKIKLRSNVYVKFAIKQ